MEKSTVGLKAHDPEVCEALSVPEVFADLFNGGIFGGKQVVNPEFLRSCSEWQTLRVQGEDDSAKVIKRFRDVKMEVSDAKSCPEIILAVEAQREVDYGMPVRRMTYDGADYIAQMKRKKKWNRRNHKLKTSAELVSGLIETDRLLPILSIVFYYGSKDTWKRPVGLHDILELPEDYLPWKDRFTEYDLNLVSSDTVDPRNFRTGLREVFELLSVVWSTKETEKLLARKRKYYSNLPRESIELISVFLDIPSLRENQTQYRNENGGINMCYAIDEMILKGEKRGERKGEARGAKKYGSLLKNLLAANRMEDIQRIAEDDDYRERLYLEYNI